MRIPRQLLILATPALLLGCDETPTGPRVPAEVELTAGQSVFIGGSANTQRAFRVEVPAGTGTLQVLLTGGLGDADLVIRHGAAPEPGLVDCVSETEANEEECIIDAPEAGTWHILVIGFTAYSDVRLAANLGLTAGATVLQSAVPVVALAGAAGSFQMFSITVPAGATLLDVTLDGPTGDADLYLRQGTFPLLNAFDQASYGTASDERVLQPDPVAGIWYVRVEGFTVFSGATLIATVTTPPAVRAPR